MTKDEITKLKDVCNLLGGPVMSYAPQQAMKEYEERIQKATAILHSIIKGLQNIKFPTPDISSRNSKQG